MSFSLYSAVKILNDLTNIVYLFNSMTMQRETNTEILSQDHLGYWVGTLGSAMRKGLEEGLAPMVVTPGQWVILEAAFAGNADTLTGLARIIPVDAAAISRQLDKLQKMGLVRRRRLRSDRRTVRIELTDDGRALVPKLAPIVRANNDKFFSGIPAADQAAFINTIQKMMQNSGPAAE